MRTDPANRSLARIALKLLCSIDVGEAFLSKYVEVSAKLRSADAFLLPWQLAEWLWGQLRTVKKIPHI